MTQNQRTLGHGVYGLSGPNDVRAGCVKHQKAANQGVKSGAKGDKSRHRVVKRRPLTEKTIPTTNTIQNERKKVSRAS
eukprot:1153897-Amphidinium_carterae.1